MRICRHRLAIPTKGEACAGVFVIGGVACHGYTGINRCQPAWV